MPIKVQCGTCGASLKAPDKAAGKFLPCPGCKQPIAVPAGNPLTADVDPQTADASPLAAESDPLAAFGHLNPQSEIGSDLDNLGADAGGQNPPGTPVDPIGRMNAGQAQRMPHGQPPTGMPHQAGMPLGQAPLGQTAQGPMTPGPMTPTSMTSGPMAPGAMPSGALPFGGQRASTAPPKKDPSHRGSFMYSAVGAFSGLVLAMLLVGLNLIIGGDDAEAENAAQQQNMANAQVAQNMPKPEPVNTPRESPLKPFGSNNDSSRQRPEPTRSNEDTVGGINRGGDRGTSRPRPGGNGGERTGPPLNTNVAINGVEPPLVEHSGETTESRFAVDFLMDGGTLLLPMRPWTTESGQETSARLQALPRAGEPIKLVTEDEQEIALAHSRLDAVDRAYLGRLMTALANSLTASGIASAMQSGTIDFDSFSLMPKGSAMEPDAMTPATLSAALDETIPLERVLPLKIQAVILSSDRSIGMIVGSREIGRSAPTLKLVNLRRKELLGSYRFPSGARGYPFGITSDDRGMFSFAPATSRKPAQIDQWTLSGNSISSFLEVPLDESMGFGKPLQFGFGDNNKKASSEFYGVVNDETVFVQMAGRLLMIDMAGGQPLYADAVDANGPPGFSAGNKYMAFQPHKSTSGAEDEVLLVDCRTLSIAGSFPAPSVTGLAFNADGTRLAGIHNSNTVKIFDAVGGKEIDEFPLPFDCDTVYWSGNDYLFAAQGSRHTIISLELGCPIARWNARGSSKPGLRVPLGGGRFLLGSQQPEGMNVRVEQLPAPAWVPETADASSFYVQLEGQSFAIDVEGTEFDETEKAELIAGVEEWVTAGGGKLDASAKLRLVCKTRPGGTQSVKFTRMESRLAQDIEFATSICEISLYDDDTLLWQESVVFGGPTIAYGSRNQLSASTADTNKPTIDFFREVKMPKRFARTIAWRELPSY